jgi:hypothetical protein
MLRAEVISHAVGILADNMAESADVLRQLLAEDVKATVRLGAARANLELGFKLRESTELEERLAALERAQQGACGTQPPDSRSGIGQPAGEDLGAAGEERIDNGGDDGEHQGQVDAPGEEGA